MRLVLPHVRSCHTESFFFLLRLESFGPTDPWTGNGSRLSGLCPRSFWVLEGQTLCDVVLTRGVAIQDDADAEPKGEKRF